MNKKHVNEYLQTTRVLTDWQEVHEIAAIYLSNYHKLYANKRHSNGWEFVLNESVIQSLHQCILSTLKVRFKCQ